MCAAFFAPSGRSGALQPKWRWKLTSDSTTRMYEEVGIRECWQLYGPGALDSDCTHARMDKKRKQFKTKERWAEDATLLITLLLHLHKREQGYPEPCQQKA